MSSLDTKGGFWSIVGKLALLVSVLYGAIQLYGELRDSSSHLKVVGEHSMIKIPIDLLDRLGELNKIKALARTHRHLNKGAGLEIKRVPAFEEEINEDSHLKNTYEVFLNEIDYEEVEYNEQWWFEIRNEGNSALEELILELPFKGYYGEFPQIGESQSGEFRNRIRLQPVSPGYSTRVYCWTHSYGASNEYDEEKTRITHKYGVKSITYRRRVGGVLAWIDSNYFFPLFFGILGLLILLIVAFFLGVSKGPGIIEAERKQKLRELEELDKLRETMNENSEDSKSSSTDSQNPAE